MALYNITVVRTQSGHEYTFLVHNSSTTLTVRHNGERVFEDDESTVALPEGLELGKPFSYRVLGNVQRPMFVVSPVIGFAEMQADPSKMDITQLTEIQIHDI